MLVKSAPVHPGCRVELIEFGAEPALDLFQQRKGRNAIIAAKPAFGRNGDDDACVSEISHESPVLRKAVADRPTRQGNRLNRESARGAAPRTPPSGRCPLVTPSKGRGPLQSITWLVDGTGRPGPCAVTVGPSQPPTKSHRFQGLSPLAGGPGGQRPPDLGFEGQRPSHSPCSSDCPHHRAFSD